MHGLSLTAASGGYSPVVVLGLVFVVASLVVEHSRGLVGFGSCASAQ